MGLAIIRMKEEMDRGFYGAPIGWVDLKGSGEFAVAIRSGLIVDSSMLVAGLLEIQYQKKNYKKRQ
ncbi:Menaquinone-specific isochorismate synthase [Listeria monocytogenes N53-1]|nr:Menaquinone-specific isochorismate synthase [Listeria monocytogenes N53-1]